MCEKEEKLNAASVVRGECIYKKGCSQGEKCELLEKFMKRDLEGLKRSMPDSDKPIAY